jgi:DNA polymerase-1
MTEELDLATWPIFHRMSRRGLLVSFEKLETLLADVQAQKEEQLVLTEVFAERPLNPMSGDDVARWMVEQGMVGKKTKGGRLTTDERALLQHDHPALNAVLEYRGLQKLESTFILPTLEVAKRDPHPDTLGGVVHPRWKLTRVRSGRVSTEDPNLLAFPSRTEMGKKVRSCFVARPGYKMVSIDYSQLEPRIAAALSQDERLLAIYREGRDLYTEVGADLGVSRTVAKTLTLGTFYGMGGNKLYESLLAAGVVQGNPPIPLFDLEACDELLKRWFETYRGVQRLVNETVAAARADGGWARTVGGRGRFLPGLFITGWGWPAAKLREEAERQCFNHWIQGTGMEELRKAMLKVDAQYTGVFPLLAIHDEMVYEVPKQDADVIANDLAGIMASKMRGVELKTEWTVGDDWGSLKV